METLYELNAICAKKDLSRDNRKKAVAILMELSGDVINAKQVAEYLMKLHYSVCLAYFDKAVTLREEKLTAVVEALRANEQFQKDKPQNFLYPKGFGSVLALAKASKYELAFSVLNYILTQAEKSGQFADGCRNNFKKTVINQKGLSVFEKLYEAVSNEDFSAKPFEKGRFKRFLDEVASKTISVTETPQTTSVATRPDIVKKEASVPQIKKDLPDNNSDLIDKIESNQADMLGMLHRLTENCTAVDILSAQIQKKDEEIAVVRSSLREKEQELRAASHAVKKSEEVLSATQSQIDDLTNRLRTSLSMDEISKNQELTTLKNDISEALKLDYSDFIGTKSSEYSQDLFEAYRSTLTRIFKLLKRFGINCE